MKTKFIQISHIEKMFLSALVNEFYENMIHDRLVISDVRSKSGLLITSSFNEAKNASVYKWQPND